MKCVEGKERLFQLCMLASLVWLATHLWRLKTHLEYGQTFNLGHNMPAHVTVQNGGYCKKKFKDLWNCTVQEFLPIPSNWLCLFQRSQNHKTPLVLKINDIVTEAVFRNVSNDPKRAPTYSKTARPKVALASFPGSGNTWTRHIVEQVSGIHTGSVYCGVVRKTFMAECNHTMHNFTIAIKTHKPGTTSSGLEFSKAVLIIRNPLDAAFAEFNRRRVGKIDTVDNETLHSEGLITFMKNKLPSWFSHSQSWLVNFTRPVHILVYENMKKDLLGETYKLASFLNVKVTYGDLWSLKKNSEGLYLRKKAPGFGPPMTEELQRLANSFIEPIREIVRNKFGIILPF